MVVEGEGPGDVRSGLGLRRRDLEHQGSDDVVGGGVSAMIESEIVTEMNAATYKIIQYAVMCHTKQRSHI